MAKKGYNIFIAYSDEEAGEIGTVYQAANWKYCGQTAPTTMFRLPHGKWKDSRLVHSSIRIRAGRSNVPDETGRLYFEVEGKKYYSGDTLPDGRQVRGGKFPYIQAISRSQRARELKQQNAEFRRGAPKHRYVYIAGSKPLKRELRKRFQWPVLPYPKRERQAA